MEDRVIDVFCAHCGTESGGDHAACRTALRMEPPRYCTACRRRMVVQVTPLGWRATCSQHGALTSP
ncbi:hypothetical protein [Actinocorallia herbida]|uniref:biotin synthase auxiliary protein BsaP n=1 Tax=Actinocorallia herbida TaxID=58109 RepID=UPI001FE8DC4A|nr:hypothetical protein [Actinocorallia herbida]